MAGVYKLDITETAAELKHLLKTQKNASDKERIQLLYLLKTEQATTVQAATALLGRHRVTLARLVAPLSPGWARVHARPQAPYRATTKHSPVGTRRTHQALTPS